MLKLSAATSIPRRSTLKDSESFQEHKTYEARKKSRLYNISILKMPSGPNIPRPSPVRDLNWARGTVLYLAAVTTFSFKYSK